jgi:hypothetical protein
MPDDSTREVSTGRVPELDKGWTGAVPSKPLQEGWVPTEEYGYQPVASADVPSPPHGGSGMPSTPNDAQTRSVSVDKGD